jgi:hypothetical protein
VPAVAKAQVVDAVVTTSIFDVNSLVAHLASSEVGVIDVPKILGITTVQIFYFFIKRHVEQSLLLYSFYLGQRG